MRGTLARANADVLVLDDPALSRDFDELQALAAGPLDARSSLRRLEEPLDALRTETAQLADKTVATHRDRERPLHAPTSAINCSTSCSPSAPR